MVELMYAALITSVADMSELKKETPISLAIPESPSEKEDQKKCKPIPDLDPSASVVSSVNLFNNNYICQLSHQICYIFILYVQVMSKGIVKYMSKKGAKRWA